jgi:ketosteroid isomerase-like protein
MEIGMPDVIDAYIQAANSRNTDRFVSLFMVDAIVHDEGQEHRGIAAIREWFESTVEKYAFTLTRIGLTQESDKAILSVRIEGKFPGSPLSARFRFVLHDGKIAKLDISA